MREAAEQTLRLGRNDRFSAGFQKQFDGWYVLDGDDRSVRQGLATPAKHQGMQIDRYPAAALAVADGVERGQNRTGMVEMSVRQHDRVDLAEIDAKLGRIAEQHQRIGPGVEQYGPALFAALRRHRAGKAVRRAA